MSESHEKALLIKGIQLIISQYNKVQFDMRMLDDSGRQIKTRKSKLDICISQV